MFREDRLDFTKLHGLQWCRREPDLPHPPIAEACKPVSESQRPCDVGALRVQIALSIMIRFGRAR
jgi:hypothetical protein